MALFYVGKNSDLSGRRMLRGVLAEAIVALGHNKEVDYGDKS